MKAVLRRSKGVGPGDHRLSSGNASVLETYISYLRHKIDALEPPLIHTVRGVGYTLRVPPDRA